MSYQGSINVFIDEFTLKGDNILMVKMEKGRHMYSYRELFHEEKLKKLSYIFGRKHNDSITIGCDVVLAKSKFEKGKISEQNFAALS